MGGATLVGLPPLWTNGRASFGEACFTLEVAGRLASYGPMSTVATMEGVVRGGRGGLAGRGCWVAGRGGRPHQLVGNGL